jgi:hypothetical protein
MFSPLWFNAKRLDSTMGHLLLALFVALNWLPIFHASSTS